MLRVASVLGMLTLIPIAGCGPEQGDAEPARKHAPQSTFAADREGGEAQAVEFNGKRAMSYLEDLCKIGPRISGTEGMRKQQDLLIKHFEAHGGKVRKQTFTARQVSQRRPVEMTNLIVSWYPERPRRVILCSHYDTRPIADQEEDRRKWHRPFISANDGGSGVALLMELAHHMDGLKLNVGVDFVFFDGEEYIFDRDRDLYFFGSRHFAREYVKGKPKYRYIAAVLFDMIAGKNPHFPAEGHSYLKAGALVAQVWKIAAQQKCTAFMDRVGAEVLDDHLALLKVGIPAIDIIDFEYRDQFLRTGYAHWHRLTDVPENCSKDGLEQVARVMIAWLPRLK
jgi:hypothetical protein